MPSSAPSAEPLSEHLALLLGRVREWRFVSSCFGEEVVSAGLAERMAWSRRHGHAHPYREILVPLSGICLFGWRGRVYECRPGTFFLCDAGEAHDLGYPPSSVPLVHLWLTVSPGDCLGGAVWMRERMQPLWRVHVAVGESRAVPCLDRLWNRVRGDASAVARERLSAGLYLLLAEIADRSRSPEHAAGDTRAECVRIACRMLDAAHGCGFDLAALARASGYSKCYFHRLFHARTGLTVHRYADARRRARAEDLVAAGMPRKEIAFELGFSSPCSFSRWLHRRQG